VTVDIVSRRLASVDEFRGFATVSMILVNFVAYFAVTPRFLKHAHDHSMTFADLVAPLFLVALGMMYRQSFTRRVAKAGRISTYTHAARRYLTILVIGLVGGAVGKMRITFDWGVLQAIGLAGVIALPFIELGRVPRLVGGGALLAAFHFGMVPFAREAIASSDQGGPVAAFGWASVVLFASVAGDLLRSDDVIGSRRRLSGLGGFFTCLGAAAAAVIPVSKPLVSPSYVLLATGISILTFSGFLFLRDERGVAIPTLESMGRNALVVFLLHYVVVRLAHAALARSAGPVLVCLGTIAVYSVCSGVAVTLDRRHIYVTV